MNEVTQLAASAPWSWRVGLTSPLRQGVALLSALVVTLGLWTVLMKGPATHEPDATLALAFLDTRGRLTWEAIDIHQEGWEPSTPLQARPWTAPGDIDLSTGNSFNADYHAGTGLLATEQATQDSTTIDLFFHRRGQPSRRWASIRDDGGPAISPDGRSVAFSTARWDTLFRYDIAVMAVDDSVPRRLTHGPSSDGPPKWSPDGSRLAFGRSMWGDGPNLVCVQQIDQSEPECRSIAGVPDPIPLGWLDADRLVVEGITFAFMGQLVVLQWSTGERVAAWEGRGNILSVSPDGQWVYCVCRPTASGELGPGVFPLSAPSLIRAVRPLQEAQRNLATVWLSSTRSLQAARLGIREQRSVQSGVPAALSALVQDARGNELRLHGAVRWSLADRGMGTIDSLTGVLTAAPGISRAVVRASAGAAASDSIVLAVQDRAARLVFEERWQSLSEWLTLGYPAPTIAADESGAVLLNNGEGSYTSSVLSTREFDPGLGLAIEARVSTPVTLAQWQSVFMSLLHHPDLSDASAAAGKNAPPWLDRSRGGCGLGYPLEGRVAGMRENILLSGTDAAQSVPAPGVLSGRWHTLIVQLLPDGRCGFALDGKAIAILGSPGLPRDGLRVHVGGNSYRTRIAVGALRVWEGVRLDIDWSAAPVFR